jgi:hypothetical protein
MRERRLILGIVRKVVRVRSIGMMQPLFEAAPDLSSWSREYDKEEVMEEFPNRGLVSWLAVRPSVEEGTVWQFGIEEQDFNADNPQHDEFRVASGASVVREVLDVRNYGTAEDIRTLVTERGIALRYLPSESLYLWVEDDQWIGPVHLQRGKKDHWLLPAGQDGQALAPLPLHRAAGADEVAELNIGGRRLFLVPGAEPGTKIGSVDWSTDAMVLKRVLTRVRKQDPNHGAALQLTQKTIEQASQIVSGSERLLERQQIGRAASIVTSLRENAEETEEFLAELLEVPAVAAKIEAAKKESIRAAKAAFDAEMAGEGERLREVQSEIEQSKEVLRGVQAEIAKRRETLLEQLDVFDEEMRAHLDAIFEKPAKFLAKVGILRAALGVAEKDSANMSAAGRPAALNSSTAARREPLLQFNNGTLGSEVRDAKQLRLGLGAAIRGSGLPLVGMRGLHAAFLSGCVPILCGPDSYELLRAYASCVAGSRVLWLPISAGLVEASDLFGRIDIPSSRFVPRLGGLVDLILEAPSLKGLVVVALDGLNRSAADAYLSPLIGCYADSQTGKAGRSLAIAHPSLLAKDDPYASLATLTWPPNVLLAGILAHDVTSIVPSAGFWAHSPLISANASEGREAPEAAKLATSEPSSRSWIGFEHWTESRRSLVPKETTQFTKVWSELGDGKLRLPAALRESCLSFYAATVGWPTEPRVALQETVENWLVPYMVARGEEAKLLELGERIVANGEALRNRVELVKETLS